MGAAHDLDTKCEAQTTGVVFAEPCSSLGWHCVTTAHRMDLTGDRTRAVHVLCGVSQVERVLLQKRPDSLILPDSATFVPLAVSDPNLGLYKNINIKMPERISVCVGM